MAKLSLTSVIAEEFEHAEAAAQATVSIYGVISECEQKRLPWVNWYMSSLNPVSSLLFSFKNTFFLETYTTN